MLDAQQPIPIYYQLKQILLEDIIKGRYGPGDRLPTEHQLCEEYQISRTPVTRALTELAEEGVIFRQRRKGTFVNPHWQRRPSARVEVRVVVSDDAWADQIRHGAPDDIDINVATVGFPDLHRALTRSVGEGRAPDLAIIDSVWVTEFAESGFLTPLADLDAEWVNGEFANDFLRPFVEDHKYRGQTYGVPEEANVAVRRRVPPGRGTDGPRYAAVILCRGTSRQVERRSRIRQRCPAPGGSRPGRRLEDIRREHRSVDHPALGYVVAPKLSGTASAILNRYRPS